MFRNAGWIALFMLLTVPGGVAAAQESPVAAWPLKQFPISFWCGPPEPYVTLEQYRAIADAGFSVVMPPCDGPATEARNRKVLDLAQKCGLKAVIADSRMPLALGSAGARAALKAIVNDYRKYPALLGYFLTDEPGASQFADLADVVAELRRLDPGRLVYINLLPNYATSDLTANPSQLNALTYDAYLNRYMDTVKPDMLSWDHYAMLKDGDRPGFFRNLASGQRAAGSTRPATPFWQIVLSVQHGPYRPLTENELRFEAMQTLTYGARGLTYFTYWLPSDPSFQWSNGIRNRDGSPGPLYAAVKRVNAEVRTLETYLYDAEVGETFQTGTLPVDGSPAGEDSLVKATGANLTVGTFRGSMGYVYVMLANRDYRAGARASVSLNAAKHAVEVLDLRSGRWKPWAGQLSGEATRGEITFGPAGAALLRWQ